VSETFRQKYCTQAEVAKVLGLSAERVRQLVMEKKLPLVLAPVVPMAAVRRFLREREAAERERSR
jgi:predicted transcriptional regulator